jgi:hypothetical protein
MKKITINYKVTTIVLASFIVGAGLFMLGRETAPQGKNESPMSRKDDRKAMKNFEEGYVYMDAAHIVHWNPSCKRAYKAMFNKPIDGLDMDEFCSCVSASHIQMIREKRDHVKELKEELEEQAREEDEKDEQALAEFRKSHPREDVVLRLYNALIKEGYKTKDIGSEARFREMMRDKNNRGQLYAWIESTGKSLGDYDKYEKSLAAAYEDDIKKLYDALSKKGYSSYDIGTEEQFRKAMKDKDVRKRLYDYIHDRGDFRIGSYEDYECRITAALSAE